VGLRLGALSHYVKTIRPAQGSYETEATPPVAGPRLKVLKFARRDVAGMVGFAQISRMIQLAWSTFVQPRRTT
jgi:hypothetical protein